MEQDQRHLSNSSDVSGTYEEEVELTSRQLLQLHSITTQIPRK